MPDAAPGDAVARALAAWPWLAEPRITPVATGLLHQTFFLRDRSADYVLQRVNPVFAAEIHENIRAVTEHLHAKGVCTLRLLPTAGDAPFADLGPDGRWRLLTRVRGVCFDVCAAPEQARSAAALVARFHSALEDLDCELRPIGFPYRDTALHLRELEEALAGAGGHRLFEFVAPLADELLREAAGWEDLGALPDRVIHGDLKFNNVLFEAGAAPAAARALCLIDLDTLARRPLYLDLGDAWRSWCNPRGEDVAEATFDLELFAASVEGYLGAVSLALEPGERASLAVAVERASLELAARFAADALRESYFAWDRRRFPSAGDHNLTRARGQLSLYRRARESRGERLRLLGVA